MVILVDDGRGDLAALTKNSWNAKLHKNMHISLPWSTFPASPRAAASQWRPWPAACLFALVPIVLSRSLEVQMGCLLSLQAGPQN